MEHLKMVDMARSPAEKAEAMNPSIDPPTYPYGLCLRLTKEELEKLEVDHTDWQVGDIFHLHALGKVTSISSRETNDGGDCCVEIQLTHLAGESESEENEEVEKEMPHEEEESEPPKKKGRPNHYF
jgi:hypothetical protein